MPWSALVLAALDLVQKLIDRGKESGELTDAEAADLQLKAVAIFLKYSVAPPPPPGA